MPPTFPVGLNHQDQSHPIQLRMNQIPLKGGATQVTLIFKVWSACNTSHRC